MKITGIEVIPFETFVDRFSNGDPYPKQKLLQILTKITTDQGAEGYYFGGHLHGDQDGLLATEQALVTQLAGPLFAGQACSGILPGAGLLDPAGSPQISCIYM